MHPPTRTVAILLNLAHALDHLALMIFATAVAAIAADFAFARWQDLMPYGAGAFLLFGLVSLPATGGALSLPLGTLETNALLGVEAQLP